MTTPTEVTITDAEVAVVRSYIGTTTLTNEAIAQRIAETLDEDGSTNLYRAAERIWLEKAGEYAHLADVSESGSSRSMSKLHTNALAMAKHFGERAKPVEVPAVVAPVGPRIASIVRP